MCHILHDSSIKDCGRCYADNFLLNSRRLSATKGAWPVAGRSYYMETREGTGNHDFETWGKTEARPIAVFHQSDLEI